MRREWTLMIRHRVVYIYRLLQLFIVAFAASTMFIRTRMGTATLQVHPSPGCLRQNPCDHWPGRQLGLLIGSCWL